MSCVFCKHFILDSKGTQGDLWESFKGFQPLSDLELNILLSCEERKTSFPSISPFLVPIEPSQAWLRVAQSGWSPLTGPREISRTFSHLFYMLNISQADLSNHHAYPFYFLLVKSYIWCMQISARVRSLQAYAVYEFPLQETLALLFEISSRRKCRQVLMRNSSAELLLMTLVHWRHMSPMYGASRGNTAGALGQGFYSKANLYRLSQLSNNRWFGHLGCCE